MKAAELKLHLLIDGIDIDYAALSRRTYKSDKYLHNDRHFVASDFRHSVPQEILIRDDRGSVCVGVLARPNSCYRLSEADGDLVITKDGLSLPLGVDLVPEPTFWRSETSDGVPMYRLLSVPGLNELNIWPWHDCAYHYDREGCAFCTTTATAARAGTGIKSNLATAFALIAPSQDTAGSNAMLDRLNQRASECVAAALSTDYAEAEYWLTLISGNLRNNQLALIYSIFAGLLMEIRRVVPHVKQSQVVANVMPPMDKVAFKLLHEAGAAVFMGNLELWTEEAFRQTCPGKYAYGRDQFLKMLEAAVATFGVGNVWSNFVCGLEPLDSQLEGFSWLARRGIVPGSNVFHKDPLVDLNAGSDFDFDGVRSYYLRAAECLHAYGLRPFYSMSSRRSSLLWEAYSGML